MLPSQPTGRWLTVKEAAEALHLDPDTVYRMAQRGELKRKKIGSRVLIDPASALPEGVSAPALAEKPVNLKIILAQADLAMQQLELLRQQVSAAIDEGRG